MRTLIVVMMTVQLLGFFSCGAVAAEGVSIGTVRVDGRQYGGIHLPNGSYGSIHQETEINGLYHTKQHDLWHSERDCEDDDVDFSRVPVPIIRTPTAPIRSGFASTKARELLETKQRE